MAESLSLKWGTIKGWAVETDETRALFQKYMDLGMSMGAAQQKDTPEQKDIICQIIDRMPGPIMNDWTGEEMSADDAKAYVREYGT